MCSQHRIGLVSPSRLTYGRDVVDVDVESHSLRNSQCIRLSGRNISRLPDYSEAL
jgi:hypothetical protein